MQQSCFEAIFLFVSIHAAVCFVKPDHLAVGIPDPIHEIAILIGCTAKGGAPQIDIGKHHGLTRRLFIHEALDAVIVLGHGNHTVQQEKQC